MSEETNTNDSIVEENAPSSESNTEDKVTREQFEELQKQYIAKSEILDRKSRQLEKIEKEKRLVEEEKLKNAEKSEDYKTVNEGLKKRLEEKEALISEYKNKFYKVGARDKLRNLVKKETTFVDAALRLIESEGKIDLVEGEDSFNLQLKGAYEGTRPEDYVKEIISKYFPGSAPNTRASGTGAGQATKQQAQTGDYTREQLASMPREQRLKILTEKAKQSAPVTKRKIG